LTRTIWLGFSFLIFLSAVASFRFAFGHFDAAGASNLAGSDGGLAFVGSNAFQGTLTSSDRLQVAHVSPANDTKPMPANYMPELSPLPPSTVVAPRVVSRHWRDLNARLIREARDRKSKRKYAKKDGIPSKATAETSNCQLEGVDAIRRALKLSAGCQS
jgi:hypothetical protein